MDLKDLEIYILSRKISSTVWEIYKNMYWQDKKTMGDQWIRSIDSVGANIAEGFGRFHYLDKNKFNLHARGSLLESIHWTELLSERNKITSEDFNNLTDLFNEFYPRLNKYIASTKERGKNN